jgi:hypothetical protein
MPEPPTDFDSGTVPLRDLIASRAPSGPKNGPQSESWQSRKRRLTPKPIPDPPQDSETDHSGDA